MIFTERTDPVVGNEGGHTSLIHMDRTRIFCHGSTPRRGPPDESGWSGTGPYDPYRGQISMCEVSPWKGKASSGGEKNPLKNIFLGFLKCSKKFNYINFFEHCYTFVDFSDFCNGFGTSKEVCSPCSCSFIINIIILL